ncbi:oxidoreductase [Jatrophihabitans sp. YIM 134969]
MPWSARDIPDQRGRTFVVTGANSGLGLSTSRRLAEAGARVVMAVRRVDEGRAAADGITGHTEVRHLDLADLTSVQRFVEDLDGEVDVVVANAGIMAVPLARTAQGFESQFGVNVLGHFALVGRLLPRLTDRVVWLSSEAHRIGKISLDDPNWERRRYRRWAAYGQSKLADLVLAYELQRRAVDAGSPLRSLAAHPGYASTNLQSHTESFQDRVMAVANRVVGQSADMGALPTLYAATVADVPGGWYLGPDGPGGIGGYPTPVTSSRRSRDVVTARALWELCERLTGVTPEV